MTASADMPPPRRSWRLTRSAWFLGVALMAAVLLTAGALVAAS